MTRSRSKTHEPIPKDHPVRPLRAGQKAKDRATCGYCGLSWDDGKPTSLTPAPGARCPFEYFHVYPEEAEHCPHFTEGTCSVCAELTELKGRYAALKLLSDRAINCLRRYSHDGQVATVLALFAQFYKGGG